MPWRLQAYSGFGSVCKYVCFAFGFGQFYIFQSTIHLISRSDVATEMSVWDGVVVTPLEKAYEPECENGVESVPVETVVEAGQVC